MDPDDAHDILPEIIDDLISYDDARYKRVLELYYTEDAELIHTFLNTKGTHNIRKVFRVWTSLNRDPPEIKDYPIYNGNVVILNLTQHLRPRIFPFIHFDVSSVTVLRLREQENGKLYIYRQEDSWTLEGLIQSVPIISWWYDNIVRPIFAAAATCAGGFLYTANTATSRLSDRANEVRDTSNSAISQGQVKAISMAHSITSGVKTRIRHARRGVISHYNKVRGNNNKKEYRYVSEPTGLEYGDDDYDLE